MKSKSLNRFLLVALVAMVLSLMFAVSAFAEEISYVDGEWTGLDFAANSYEYAPATLNETATALVAGEYSALAESDVPAAGLHYIRVVGSEDTSILYVQGSNALNLWVEESDGVLAVADSGDVGDITFIQGKWTGPILGTDRKVVENPDPKYNFGGYDLSHSDLSTSVTSEGHVDGMINHSIYPMADYGEYFPIVESYNYAYQYMNDQIIPMQQFISFKFCTGKTDGQINQKVGTVSTILALYVAKSDGSVVIRTAKKPTLFNAQWYAGQDVTFELADFGAEIDGYIVGMVIYPYGEFSEESTFTFRMASSSYPVGTGAPMRIFTKFYQEEYKVNLRGPAKTPVLTMDEETGLVSGFEEGVVYEYAPYSVNGAGEWADVADNANFKVEAAGLTAIRVKESLEAKASLPVIFYVRGTQTENLWVEASEGNLAVADSIGLDYVTFIEGTWTAPKLASKRYQNVDAQGRAKYTYGGYDLSTTETTLTTSVVTGTGTSTDFLTSFAPLLAKYNFAYQYTPDQVVPMREFMRFTFDAGDTTSRFLTTSGNFNTVLALYVATENGEIEVRTAKKAMTASEDWARLAEGITFTIEDFGEETDGYIVGMAIYPFGDYSEVGGIELKGVTRVNPGVRFVNATYKIDARVPADKPALTRDEATGLVSGFVEGVVYEYAPYTVNGASEWTDVADITNFVVENAGLTAIRVKENEDIKASLPVIFYVKGLEYKNLWIEESEGTLAVANATNGLNPFFVEGKWTGRALTTARRAPADAANVATSANAFDGYSLSQTSTELSSGGCIPDSMVRNEHYPIGDYGVFFDNVMAFNYSYQYTQGQIIPMDEFVSFSFITGKVDGQFKVAPGTTAYSVLELYVVNEDGEIEKRRAQKEAVLNSNWGCQGEVSFELSDFAETDGYIVGMSIYPYGAFSEDAYITFCMAGANTARANPAHLFVKHFKDSYKVMLPPAERPVLTMDEATGLVSGFEEGVVYEYGAFGANGGTNWADIADITNFVIENAGLTAVRVKETAETSPSDPVIFFVRGNGTQTLWSESSEGVLAVADSEGLDKVTFIEGAWTSPSLSLKHAQAGGYALATSQTVLTTNGFIPADVLRNGVYPIDHFVNAAGVKFYDLVNSHNFAYQYKQDQIIPMDEFITFTFDTGKVTGQYKVADGTTVYSVLEIYVVDEYGVIEKRRAQKETVLNSNWACQGTVTFSISDFAETDGYIVGMAIYPYGAFSDNAEIVHCQAGAADSYRTAPSHLLVDFTNAKYVVKLPADNPNPVVFPIPNGGYGQIGGLDPKFNYEIKYKANAEDSYPAEWDALDEGITYVNVPNVGYYLIRAREDASFFESEAIEIYIGVAGDFVSLANEVKTFYLPEDFEEAQVEYEIDVTDKSWVASLLLNNIAELSPEATVAFVAENYKFVVSATEFDPDKIIHYYNIKVSFGDESKHNVAHNEFVELAGDTYITDYFVEGIDGVPFKTAKIMIYLGNEYNGSAVSTKRLHTISGRLASVETATVVDGWVTFNNFDDSYVVVLGN